MRQVGRFARDLAAASLCAAILGLLLRTFVAQVYTVPSDSMEPQLRTGDFVLVNKMVARAPRRGLHNAWLPQREPVHADVLVFPHPTEAERLLIKRCVAHGGELLQIKDKELFVDRELVSEAYTQFRDERTYPASSFLPEEIRLRDQFGPQVIAEGGLFCLGDNRDASLDSRHFGEVEAARVVGQAVLGFRPWSHLFLIR